MFLRRGQRILQLGVRHRSQQKNIAPKKAKSAVQRDAMGRLVLPQREKSLGIFKPLSVTQLKHELFESEEPGRVELDRPPMQARMLAPGVVTRFNDSDPTSPLRVFGVPKHMLLEFRILGAPCSVTTATTLSLIRALEEAKSHPARLVLNGRPGCGKSFLLLQAAQYAASTREWIVLYIPRARRLVDASTPYAYSLATRTYAQPRAARETLARLGRANAHLLAHLRTTVSVTLDGKTVAVPVRAGAPLLALVDAGTADEAAAPAALDALLRELGAQTRFPVLLAIDDFQALAGGSMYRDPHFRMIRPHHLGLPRLLLEYASGRRTLARGLVLGALTRSDPQFPVSDQLAASLRIPEEFEPTPRSVRYRRSAQLAAYLEHEIEVVDPAAQAVDEDAHTDSANVDESAAPAADANSAPSAVEPPWTGWRVYDPPTFEDAVGPTAANPFPTPAPAALWKGMVLADSDSDGAVAETQAPAGAGLNSDVDVDAEGEVGAGDGAEPVRVQQNKQKQKQKQKQKKEAAPKTVRALRAIRVPDALSVREAAALFELWLDAGVLRTGGERRAARRAELQAVEEWRTVKGEVDADPETAYDSDADAVDDNPLDSKQVSAAHALGAATKHHVVSAHALDATQDALDADEFADVRALERRLGAEAWVAQGAAQDARIVSLDAERERDLAQRAALELEQAAGEVQDSADATAVASTSAKSEVQAADAISADVLMEEDEFEESKVDADASSADVLLEEDEAAEDGADDLELGTDDEIAELLSDGLRGALGGDAASLSELLRAPLAGELQASKEAGADELFLAKYAESSGNARVFVWGGLLATLQTLG